MQQLEFIDLVGKYGDQVEHLSAVIAHARLTGTDARTDDALGEHEESLRELRRAIMHLRHMPAESLDASTGEALRRATEQARAASATVNPLADPQDRVSSAIGQAQRHFADIVRPLEIIGRWPPDELLGSRE